MSRQPMVSRQRGLSIVEFMVGIAVGLFVVGGAAKFFTDYLVSNKRLLLETRVNQDLRAAADLVARDVRRAGYWDNATTGVWSSGSTAITPNPHATSAGAIAPTAGTTNFVTYTHSRNADDVRDSNEFTGFRLQTVSGINVLQVWDGGVPGAENWQSVTDPGTVNVTAFSVTAANPALVNNLSRYCSCLSRLTCTNTGAAGARDIANPAFNPAGPPMLTIPSFQIVLTGQAVNDPAITRTVSEAVRVRNAILTGSCPL